MPQQRMFWRRRPLPSVVVCSDHIRCLCKQPLELSAVAEWHVLLSPRFGHCFQKIIDAASTPSAQDRYDFIWVGASYPAQVLNQLERLPELDVLRLIRVHALRLDAEEMFDVLEFDTLINKLVAELFQLRLEKGVFFVILLLELGLRDAVFFLQGIEMFR